MISIIIPAYNIEDCISRCLESVMSQTEKDIEIIMVDDGSTDDTGKIIDEYAKKDSRIKVFHKENEGASKARILGIKNATGEYIGFVDGDDKIESNMFEVLLSNMKKTGADISHCGYTRINHDGRVTYFYNTRKYAVQNRNIALKELIKGNFEPSLCTKLFKREIVTDVIESGEFDDTILTYEDLFMNFLCFSRAKKIVYKDICPYFYIKRKGSVSSQVLSKKDIWDSINMRQTIVDKAEDESVKDSAKVALIETVKNMYNALLIRRSDGEKDEMEQVRQALFNNIESIHLLDIKSKILVKILMKNPDLYNKIYLKYKK